MGVRQLTHMQMIKKVYMSIRSGVCLTIHTVAVNIKFSQCTRNWAMYATYQKLHFSYTLHTYVPTSNKKTFENVTGCRDTRTAKSKETRQG